VGVNLAEVLRGGARVRRVLRERHSDGISHLAADFSLFIGEDESQASGVTGLLVPDTWASRNTGRLVCPAGLAGSLDRDRGS
jgi:hypothetical protein